MHKLILISFLLLTSSPSFAKKISAKVEDNNLLIKCQGKIQKLAINKDKELDIEGRPKIFESENFSLIIIELADHNSGTALVYSINTECKNLWTFDLQSFNPSIPLIEENYIFLGAMGHGFKLHRQSGKVIWSHKDLYKKYKFNGADPIVRAGQLIKFSKILAIDDQSGKIKVLNK